MPRPRTVQEALQSKYPDNDWSDFAPVMPDSLATVHAAIQAQWERPWEIKVAEAPIDLDRTNKLPKWDGAVKCGVSGVYGNVHDGVPFAYADGSPTYPVCRRGWQYLFTPPTRVPMPNPVPRLGDPTGLNTDLQYFGIDRLGLWEVSAFGPAWWRAFKDMAAENITRWFYATNWFEQRTGMTGAKMPFLPMLPTIEEMETSIEHALHMVVLYGTEDHVYPARNSDALAVRRPGMPLRAGERLRLRLDVGQIETRMNRKLTRHELAVVRAMQTYGVIVDDVRPAPDAHIRMPMDSRVNINLNLKLSDYVVLLNIPREKSPGYRAPA